MSKAQAARTFSMSLSSVKRYVGKANRGEPLAPKKSPGSAPKLDEKRPPSCCSKRTSRNALTPPSKSAATTYTPSRRGSR